MILTAEFLTNQSVNHGKIRMSVTDEDGLTGGPFKAFFGVISPAGTTVANIATQAGTFGSAGTYEQFYDLPFVDNQFLPGTYTIRVIVRNAANTLITDESVDYDWKPVVVKNSSLLAENSAVINVTTSYDCSPKVIEITNDTDNTGFTVASTLFSTTAPVTPANPAPTPSTLTSVPYSVDGEYTTVASITRSKNTSFSLGAIVVIESEKLVKVVKTAVNCNKYCDLATKLQCKYDEITGTLCSGGLSMKDQTEAIITLYDAVLFMLSDKCGDSNAATTHYNNIAGADCGCGCQ